jgi:hypothetical protein
MFNRRATTARQETVSEHIQQESDNSATGDCVGTCSTGERQQRDKRLSEYVQQESDNSDTPECPEHQFLEELSGLDRADLLHSVENSRLHDSSTFLE